MVKEEEKMINLPQPPDDFYAGYTDQNIKLARSIYESCIRKRNKVKTNYRTVISAFFSRGLEILESILLLVLNDRITDAGVLLRSLANLIINLGYIEKEKEKRSILFLCDAATQHRKLYEKSRILFSAPGEAKVADSYILHYKKEEIKMQNIIDNKYPNSTPWQNIKIAERAKAIPQNQYLYDLLYADLSRFEHHDFSAMRAYVDPNTCNPIIKTGSHRHSPVLNREGILMMSNIILGMIMESFNGEYQLKWKDKIDEMARKLATKEQLTPAS